MTTPTARESVHTIPDGSKITFRRGRARSTAEADIFELFSAIQGEGPYVGQRQIFLRFMGCNLTCAYCDTPARQFLNVAARVEQTPGARDFIDLDNPISLEAVQTAIQKLAVNSGLHSAISFTGGEPLLYSGFIKHLVPFVHELGLKTYLETGGVLDRQLDEIIDGIDIVSMDIKLKSAAGFDFPAAQHAVFLKAVRSKEVFVKVVFVHETTDNEIDEAAVLVQKIDPSIPLILQPVTPFGPFTQRPTPGQTLHFQELACRRLSDVRVIPQTHPLIGQL